MENMIKEHKTYLASDRTSCHRWEANQFRLLLHTAAYWLMLDLRNAAPRKSRWRSATFETIRTTFLKIAARIETLKTPHPRLFSRPQRRTRRSSRTYSSPSTPAPLERRGKTCRRPNRGQQPLNL